MKKSTGKLGSGLKHLSSSKPSPGADQLSISQADSRSSPHCEAHPLLSSGTFPLMTGECDNRLTSDQASH